MFIAALAHSGAFGVEKSSHSKSRTNLGSVPLKMANFPGKQPDFGK
jgi:hypothetical protein